MNEEARLENDSLEVAIALKGAELQSIRRKATNTEYLWQGNPDYWHRRAIVMFPVNVAFRDRVFTHKGERHDMPFLGLVESGNFKRVGKDGQNEVVLEYQNEPGDLSKYPFPFRFQVRYALSDSTLTQEYRIENRGKERMYFAAGGHPGFRTPLKNGMSRGDYQIRFSERLTTDRVEISANLRQLSRVPYLNDEDSIALNDPRVPDSGMFLQSSPARVIGVGRVGEEPYITVSLEDFPNANLWTPTGMPFVCIEPMVGHHDAVDASYEISEKECVVWLDPGEHRSYRFLISINESVAGP